LKPSARRRFTSSLALFHKFSDWLVSSQTELSPAALSAPRHTSTTLPSPAQANRAAALLPLPSTHPALTFRGRAARFVADLRVGFAFPHPPTPQSTRYLFILPGMLRLFISLARVVRPRHLAQVDGGRANRANGKNGWEKSHAVNAAARWVEAGACRTLSVLLRSCASVAFFCVSFSISLDFLPTRPRVDSRVPRCCAAL
jgi:hypothetical protein